MAAAFRLSSEPGWREKYDITVYQMRWRLGGKGASGRNAAYFDQIEEHGLHVWFGCYDNAWRLLRACYEELGRRPGEPLATLEEAFEPANSFVGMEQINGEWQKWPIRFPSNGSMPGRDTDDPSIWETFRKLIRLFAEGVLGAHVSNAFGSADLGSEDALVLRRIHESLSARFSSLLRWSGLSMDTTDIYALVEQLDEVLDYIGVTGDFSMLLTAMEQTRNWLWEEVCQAVHESHAIRRIWLMFDLIVGNLCGMIKDGVLHKGYAAINGYDYREWVARHSKTPEMTAESSVVQAFYSVIFAGHKQHSFEAGNALKGALRIALHYKGAYFYRMNAGMGDVVFTPLYQVLKKRGVKFAFFHKVRNLGLSPDGKSIATIQMDVQATAKEGAYEPLVRIKGLDCWPSEPLYDQLVEGDALRASKANLESDWEKWSPISAKTLVLGRDFD